MKLIKAEEVIAYIKNHDYELVSRMGCVDRGMFTTAIEHAINIQKPVEAMEVIHGHWIERANIGRFDFKRECSICHAGSDLATVYCHNCAAKMDGDMTNGQ